MVVVAEDHTPPTPTNYLQLLMGHAAGVVFN